MSMVMAPSQVCSTHKVHIIPMRNLERVTSDNCYTAGNQTYNLHCTTLTLYYFSFQTTGTYSTSSLKIPLFCVCTHMPTHSQQQKTKSMFLSRKKTKLALDKCIQLLLEGLMNLYPG